MLSQKPGTTSSGFAGFLKSIRRTNKDAKLSRHPAGNTINDIECDWVRHSALKLAFEGDFKAPLQRLLQAGGNEVLDIGCGSGFWTMDMATKYRLSHFTGIDVDKNILPTNNVPKNLRFYQVNLVDTPLPFEDSTFDYIFIRAMISTLPDEAWDSVLNELVRIMKKGAYIECIEAYPDLFEAGPAMTTIMNLNHSRATPEASVSNGSSSSQMAADQPSHPHVANQNPWPNRLAACNQLVGMQIKHTHTPVGAHGGAVGTLLLEYWDRYIQLQKPIWIQNKMISESELKNTLKVLHKEIEENKTYMSWYSVTAQKRGYNGPLIQFSDADA
ncbi:S-adenosyl-L-methionine-dependent methyltransferase [Radiomyces spectabilis]|uniref:S-adenosyl-L-methionine-dependent methyltransferase n=1 Tax=Radiomyces spectabilis TaxID=64574 RepID=UPI00221EEC01|nr:S-adenosyl-L-methionine-dependent methyltransferase [Radiomyces spectabilis]KAI8370334.1 S-adenosyl-L-methionine-dependent methyltransferase [Radiomyces spectabilis]